MQEFPFELRGHEGWPIRGEVRTPTGGPAQRVVVISHGFKGFKDWGFFPELGRRLAGAGYAAVTFNFSGNGVGADPLRFTEEERFRDNTLTREIDDLAVVLNAALASELPGLGGQPARGPALLGHSRGGLVSTVVATRDARVRRLVTWNGVSELALRFPEPMRAEWRRQGFVEVVNSRTGQVLNMGLAALDDLEAHLLDYAPVRLAPGISIPWLIVHGTVDRTVGFEEAEAMARAGRPERVRLCPIPGGDHTMGVIHPYQRSTAQLDQAVAATLEFLAEDDAEGREANSRC